MLPRSCKAVLQSPGWLQDAMADQISKSYLLFCSVGSGNLLAQGCLFVFWFLRLQCSWGLESLAHWPFFPFSQNGSRLLKKKKVFFIFKKTNTIWRPPHSYYGSKPTRIARFRQVRVHLFNLIRSPKGFQRGGPSPPQRLFDSGSDWPV